MRTIRIRLRLLPTNRFRWHRIAVIVVSACFACMLPAAGRTQVPASTRQVFLQAHALHQQLLKKPPAERTAAEYKRIIALLEPLWKDPKAAGAASARYNAAALYVDWARDRDDPAAYAAARHTLLDLLRATPYTAYRRNAEWALAQIEMYHLDKASAARIWLKDFARRYPADPRTRIAKEQLRGRKVAEPGFFVPPPTPAKLPVRLPSTPPRASVPNPGAPTPIELSARGSRGPATIRPASPGQGAEVATGAAENAGKPAAPQSFRIRMGNVTGIRVFTNTDASSVVISLRHLESFTRGALPKQHLVYFDISSRGAHRTASRPARWQVDDGRVGTISIAAHPGFTRVVIETLSPAAADRGRTFPNPARLIVGVKGGTPKMQKTRLVPLPSPDLPAAVALAGKKRLPFAPTPATGGTPLSKLLLPEAANRPIG